MLHHTKKGSTKMAGTLSFLDTARTMGSLQCDRRLELTDIVELPAGEMWLDFKDEGDRSFPAVVPSVFMGLQNGIRNERQAGLFMLPRFMNVRLVEVPDGANESVFVITELANSEYTPALAAPPGALNPVRMARVQLLPHFVWTNIANNFMM